MRILASTLLLLSALLARADWYNATITVTNTAGTTNGQSYTVGSDTRTWTNSVYVAGSQVLTNASRAGAAANMLVQASSYPFAGVQIYSAANGFTVRKSSTFTATVSPGWGLVTYSTNSAGVSAISVQMPLSTYSAEQQTNIASALAAAINSAANTNAIRALATNLTGAVLEAKHATNADRATYSQWATNLFGSIAQAAHATNADFATEAAHGTNADFATESSHATNADLAMSVSSVGPQGNLSVTNSISYGTNSFAGTTVDMSQTYQMLDMAGAVNVTGFANQDATKNLTAVVRLWNHSGGNLQVTWPGSVLTADGSRGAWVTNNLWRIVTFSTFGNLVTNASTSPFW